MKSSEILQAISQTIPSERPNHMLSYFSRAASCGIVHPFTMGLCTALSTVESIAPGYVKEMLGRIAAIAGEGQTQYEAIIQILAEIYVTSGAAQISNPSADDKVFFILEPGREQGIKNPEFAFQHNGIWCAVEVKTPQLINHSRERSQRQNQVASRVMPKEIVDKINALPPRDNPVKDFLISANEKFKAYSSLQKDAFHILIIVWDDFIFEPISALINESSGLLTENSFFRDSDGPFFFPYIDGIVLIRYQHQIIQATQNKPLFDDVTFPLQYHHAGFPPKAFIQNPVGNEVPQTLITALNAVPLIDFQGAEYRPVDTVMWFGDDKE